MEIWKKELSNLNTAEENIVEDYDTNATKINPLDYSIRKRHSTQVYSRNSTNNKTASLELMSLYSIRNQIGYPVRVCKYSKDKKRVFSIQNDMTIGMDDLKDDYDVTNQNPFELVSHFDIEVFVPRNTSGTIDEDHPLILQNLRMGGMTEIGLETLTLSGGVNVLKKIELIGTRTVVSLCSTVCFSNKTCFEVTLQITNQYCQTSLTIEPYSERFLPLDFLIFTARIKIRDLRKQKWLNWSEEMEFNTKTIKSEAFTEELKIQNMYFLLTQQRHPENFDFINISLQPTFAVTSFLPFRVAMGFGEENVNHNYELFPKDTAEIYEFSSCSLNLEWCLVLSGVGSTKTLPVFKDLNQGSKDIFVETPQGETGCISVKCLESAGEFKKIYLYSKILVLNNSPFRLRFHTMANLFDSEMKTLATGTAHDLENESYECTLGYIPEQLDKNIHVSCQETFETLSDDFKTEALGVKVISLKNRGLKLKTASIKSDSSFVSTKKEIDLGLQITMWDNLYDKPNNGEGLYTKYFILTPRYVLVNNSSFAIQVCQYHALQKALYVHPMGRRPMFWPDSNKK